MLRKSQKNTLLAAYVDYFMTGQVPDMPQVIKPYFEAVKPHADAIRSGIENGKRGGNPKLLSNNRQGTVRAPGHIGDSSENMPRALGDDAEKSSRDVQGELENVSRNDGNANLPAQTSQRGLTPRSNSYSESKSYSKSHPQSYTAVRGDDELSNWTS
jgi:hypothetical protein